MNGGPNDDAIADLHLAAGLRERRLSPPNGSHWWAERLVDGTLREPIRNSVSSGRGRTHRRGRDRRHPPRAGTALQVISTEGMTVLPGLWDMHVHLMIIGHADYAHWDRTYLPQLRDVIMPAAARQLLMAGVTSARDLGAPLEDSIAVRDAHQRSGEIPGPTLFVSGPFIQQEPYPGTEAVPLGRERRRPTRAPRCGGSRTPASTSIKLIDQDQMSDGRGARRRRRGAQRTTCRSSPTPTARRRSAAGLRHGVDNFEHTGLGRGARYPEDIIAALRERTAQHGRRTALLDADDRRPLQLRVHATTTPSMLDDPRGMTGLPPDDRRRHPPLARASRRIGYFQHDAAAPADAEAQVHSSCARAGVMLLIGTDSGIPMKFHSRQHLERARHLGEPARRARRWTRSAPPPTGRPWR